jgi:hypothetical protein
MFWYMIEATLALVAVCLPPLSNARRVRPVESVVRSVRSAWSMRSNRSNGSKTGNAANGLPMASPTSSKNFRNKHAEAFLTGEENPKHVPAAVLKGDAYGNV